MTNPSLERATVRAAIISVVNERERQIEQEGWSREHDDTHTGGEMALAATCYAICSTLNNEQRQVMDPDGLWPWAPEWWKPKDRRRDLVRAAALIIAEIERLDRLANVREAEDG